MSFFDGSFRDGDVVISMNDWEYCWNQPYVVEPLPTSRKDCRLRSITNPNVVLLVMRDCSANLFAQRMSVVCNVAEILGFAS